MTAKMLLMVMNAIRLLREDIADDLLKYAISFLGKAIFTNPDTKSPYKPGELFQQPQLAHFIQNLQKHGKNYMYKGNWARQFINTLKNHGGKITSRDLSRYEPQWLEPASTTYSGYHVTTTGSKWGGVELIEMLQLLKEAGVGSANDSYLTNSSTLHALMSISEYSQFISDYLNIKREGVGTIKEFFQVDATVKGRLSNRSADTIWGHLSNSEGVEMIKQSFTELLSELPNFDKHRELKRGSSGIVAIDNQGNICAMAHTANSNPWGTGLFVEGVALPHSGAVFQDILGSLRPGSHIPSGLQPVIIFKEKLKEEKKVVITKEKVEKPVRVTDAPTTGSTKRELGPIGPRGIWESTDHMTRVTEQKRHLTPTNEIPRIERKIADHRMTAKGQNRPPTRYPRDEKESGVSATENVKVFSVTENPLKRKLSRAPSSVKIARPTAKRTETPQFEMGPLIGPRGVWGSPGRLVTVPKHLRPTASSTTMRTTTDIMQRFVLTKSQLPRTGLQRSAVFSARGRNSFKLRPELRRHWNNEIGEEVQEKLGKEQDEGVENKENRVEERGFESVEEEEEREGLEEELVVKEEDGEEIEEEEDENEPLSIGGLYTENDLDTILPPPFTPIRGHYRILNKSRQNWFRNFVREIFRRQQKRHKLWKKIYQRKKTTRTRWSKPFAALSVIGQSAPEALLQYINNLIDNKMDAKQASDTPMFFSSIPGSRRQTLRLERFIFSNDVISEVRSRGTDVKEVHNKEGRVIAGEGAVISVTDRQERYGCSHPDSEGYAESL